MKYFYFVRYTAIDPVEVDGDIVRKAYQGQTEVTVDYPIDCMWAIRAVCEHLAETYHEGSDILIDFYTLLRTEGE